MVTAVSRGEKRSVELDSVGWRGDSTQLEKTRLGWSGWEKNQLS